MHLLEDLAFSLLNVIAGKLVAKLSALSHSSFPETKLKLIKDDIL